MYRDFQRSVPLKSAMTILVLTNMVFTQIQPCLAKRAKPPKKEIISEKPSLDLIEKLAHQPELLTPEYLQYVLGRPAKRNVADGSNVVMHWQTADGGIGTQDCELAQTRDANQRIIRASFKINLPRSTVTLIDIEKKINEDRGTFADKSAAGSQNGSGSAPANSIGTATSGQGTQLTYGAPALVPITGRKLFDQECRPSLQYSFVPYTKVYYTQAANTFHVHRAQIDYAGPPLPPPSQQDIAEVATGMRTRALAHQANDKSHLAVPLLNDHLMENPSDAQAHFALGQSYQKSSHLNEAIAEYQLALRYSNGDNVVANNAVQSLQLLHVMPSPDDRMDFHTLKFKQNGQGLTEGDVIASQDRQSLLANQAPVYGSNPSAANGSYGSGMPMSQPSGMNGFPPAPSSGFNTMPLNGASKGQYVPAQGMSPGANYISGSNTMTNSFGRSGNSGSSGAAYPGANGMPPNPPANYSGAGSSGLVGLKAPPAGSLNLSTAPPSRRSRTALASTAGAESQPENVRYAPADSASVNAVTKATTGGQPSFYDSMQYGSNLFPATAGNPNLEPGF